MSLQKIIINSIKHTGAINLSTYMELCLQTYYNKAIIFGEKGDFITSPEICQTFGEMLAIWAIGTWQQMGAPSRFTFCEIGPGRGTLMKDLLRTIKKIKPDFLKASDITLIENSERLQKHQQHILNQELPIKWIKSWNSIIKQPIIIISNEILDALPIDQYIYKNGAFFAHKIGLNENEQLQFIIEKNSIEIEQFFVPLPDKVIIEISEQQIELISNIAQHIKKFDGSALFIDYGELIPAYGDSLQAVKDHKYVNPLTYCGECDITTHVNFYHLAKIAQRYNCSCFGKTQKELLIDLGIQERAKRLKSNSADRLINEKEMG